MECKNCHSILNEDLNYCPSCGGKIIRNRLTLKNLLQHFSESYLNYDNKFLKTFINLFKKPEDVIGSYIEGTRRKYADVISYFAIAITLSGLQMFILNKFFPEAIDISYMATQGTEEIQRKNLQIIQEYQSFIMMLSIPVYALMSKIVFLKFKKYNYTEHLVIYMYIISQTSIVSALVLISLAPFGITLGELGIYSIPLQIIYSAYCLKCLFNLRLKTIVLRTLLFLAVLLVFYAIFILLAVLFLVLTGDMQELIEAQKNARV